MTDAKEPILLKVIAPPSHTALSGDVTVLILDSVETEPSTTASTSIAASTVTNDTRKDEKNKIDPKEGRAAATHEPLVLRYAEKVINANTHTAWASTRHSRRARRP